MGSVRCPRVRRQASTLAAFKSRREMAASFRAAFVSLSVTSYADTLANSKTSCRQCVVCEPTNFSVVDVTDSHGSRRVTQKKTARAFLARFDSCKLQSFSIVASSSSSNHTRALYSVTTPGSGFSQLTQTNTARYWNGEMEKKRMSACLSPFENDVLDRVF